MKSANITKKVITAIITMTISKSTLIQIFILNKMK